MALLNPLKKGIVLYGDASHEPASDNELIERAKAYMEQGRPNDALDFYPPAQWPASHQTGSKIIRHDLDVNLNPATPPGHYKLMLGLEGHETQYPLTTIEVK